MNGPLATDGNWVFNLDDTPKKPQLSERGKLVSVLGEADRWAQYEDKLVYELDCLVRDWIAENCKNTKWKNNYRLRRYTMKMVYEQIYGIPYSRKNTGRVCRILPKILRYYSSRVQAAGSINNKMYSKTIYTIAPKRLDKPPYSLRLRLEWFADRGIIPSYENMRLPKDDLKPGHARNPKTEANMEARRERARARYRERYKRNR